MRGLHVLAITLYLAALGGLTGPPLASAADPVITELVTLHNQERSQAGLSPLTSNAKLMAAAQRQARYMAEHEETTHQGPRGTTPKQRVVQQDYRALRVAENVASGHQTPQAVLQSWLRSPPHRQNILGQFAEIGAARASSAAGRVYWCVVFGLPAPTLDPRQAAAQVVQLLNQARTEAGASPLRVDSELTETARTQARTLAKRHTPQRRQGDSANLPAQLAPLGSRYRKLGQSTASGVPTPQAVIQGIMDNAAQRQQVLGDFTDIGVGYAAAEDGTPYWRILLGAP